MRPSSSCPWAAAGWSRASPAFVSTRPEVRVVGVEPAGAAKMSASIAAGQPVTLASTNTIADGLMPVRPGDLTFEHARRSSIAVVTVDDAAIARAALWLFHEAKQVVEPSGAATVAAVLWPDADGPACGRVKEGRRDSQRRQRRAGDPRTIAVSRLTEDRSDVDKVLRVLKVLKVLKVLNLQDLGPYGP